jgi:hypothetical protein
MSRFASAGHLAALQRGTGIRGHYMSRDELVIRARPCLVLLPAWVDVMPPVHHLRILGALCVIFVTDNSYHQASMKQLEL